MKVMKKILIITYYWPPSGGGGVMRWLKMSKFFPEMGWQPIIYTPQNPDSSVIDESLLNEIHPDVVELKTPIWEPYNFYRKLTGQNSGTKFKAGYISEASSGDWKSKLSVFIRGNFLIPDPRKFWIKPSIKYLSQLLEDNQVDAMVSTGPPHSTHLIALGLKKKFDIPWIADFRDPWTKIDFYDKLRLIQWADKKHHNLENNVLQKADHVVTVSPSWQEDFELLGNRKIELITNGYDPNDFNEPVPEQNELFIISHFGAFNQDRNPHSLWTALHEISTVNDEFSKKLRIQLIGQTDESILNSIQKNNLKENLVLQPFMPHKEGLKLLAKSSLLLLPVNDAPNVKGILPGKMYEYMALRRPIIAIGPTNADFAKIVKDSGTGNSFNFDDVDGIKKAIKSYFELFLKNKLQVEAAATEQFSRKTLAKKYITLLEN
jgi:glycosyltransferase involved in cell wall biosynthesis